MHPWPPIGENIARLRSLSGLTQEELAERAGVSVDLIRRLEQGNRQTALIGSLYKIANGLDVPLSVLLSQQPVFSPPETDELPSEAGPIEGLRQLLQPVAAGLAPPATPDVGTLPELQRASRDAWRLYQAGQLAEVALLLPGFIVSGQQLARDTHGHDRDQALVESSQLYNVSAGLLTILGFEDLGYAAAAEALTLAHAADDTVAPLEATYTLGWVLMRQGRMAEAEALAVQTSEANEPRFGQAAPAHLSAWGHLLKIGTTAAIRQERHGRANDLLNLMQLAAHRLDGDYVNDYHQWYGPTTVAKHAVSLAAESGEYGKALSLAASVSPNGGLAKHTRMSYLLEVANAQAHEHRRDDAIATLFNVRSQAAELLRYQVLAREIVRMLLDMKGSSRSRSEQLRELATFVNV